MARVMAEGVVRAPPTTSIRGISCGGLKGCATRKFSPTGWWSFSNATCSCEGQKPEAELQMRVSVPVSSQRRTFWRVWKEIQLELKILGRVFLDEVCGCSGGYEICCEEKEWAEVFPCEQSLVSSKLGELG